MGQQLLLLPQKAILWEDNGTLLLADWHLGKVSHFRKAGVAVPGAAAFHDYQVLNRLLQTHDIRQVIILGDLFHSVINSEWSIFSKWMQGYPSLPFILVKGNHDILPEQLYDRHNIQVFQEQLVMPPFVFTHIPLENQVLEHYNLSGHIHPAVKLIGKGNQQLTFPCFYFGPTQGLLPAFGTFTGKATIRPVKESSIFIIAQDQVLPV
ncbi:MAG: ligase-associated DNA damage response endonuclease PdeM [Bacteroidota bacterium]